MQLQLDSKTSSLAPQQHSPYTVILQRVQHLIPLSPLLLVLLLLPPPPLLLTLAAAATCNKPFEPNPAAEACFKDKEACWQRDAKGLLTGPEKQALGMLQYPPKTDRWGRQAFDYADDVSKVVKHGYFVTCQFTGRCTVQ